MFWIFAALFAVGEAISGPAKGVLEIKNIENKHRAEIIAVFVTIGYLFEALSPFLAGILLTFLEPQKILLIYSLAIWISLGVAGIILKARLRKIQRYYFEFNLFLSFRNGTERSPNLHWDKLRGVRNLLTILYG